MMIRIQLQNNNGEQRRKGIFKEELGMRAEPTKTNESYRLNQTGLLNEQIKTNSELSKRNQELLRLLGEERQKYQSLFGQYQELNQKNSLIEREYMNMKYEHNKTVKQLKKNILQLTDHYISACLSEFRTKIQAEVLWTGIRTKIEELLQNIALTTQTVSTHLQQQNKSQHSTPKRQKIEKVKYKSPKGGEPRSSSISPLNHLPSSPKKSQEANGLKEAQYFSNLGNSRTQYLGNSLGQMESGSSVRSSRKTHIEQIVCFQDEYYGQLKDFKDYEEKVQLRRNHQMMKRCAKGEGRRKKIFTPNVA